MQLGSFEEVLESEKINSGWM